MGTGRVRRAVVPPGLREDGRFAGAGYASAFRLRAAEGAGGGGFGAEGWARAVFEGAPVVLRLVLVAAWSVGLGLRLGPRQSSGHVLGWEIEHADAGTVVLHARSRLLDAWNVVVAPGADAEDVVWVTFVRFNRPAGRLLWGAAAPVHHVVLPCLLGRAGRAVRATYS
jgi:hypothetical protein